MPPINNIYKYFTLVFFFTLANAQERPFLFTIVPQTETSNSVVLHYDLAYGKETFEPLGGDNIEQTFGIQTGIGESFMLVGQFSFATDDLTTHSSQRIELLGQALNAQDNAFDFSVGPGFLHEYGGTNVLLARGVIGRHFTSWQIYSNCLLEKAFSENRDPVDLFLTTGFSYSLSPSLHLGFEAVGQDLEGFWDTTEAEGGATLFAGPTITTAIPTTSWRLNLGAGPIVRATHSIQTSFAPRDIPASAKNGFVVHAVINFGV